MKLPLKGQLPSELGVASELELVSAGGVGTAAGSLESSSSPPQPAIPSAATIAAVAASSLRRIGSASPRRVPAGRGLDLSSRRRRRDRQPHAELAAPAQQRPAGPCQLRLDLARLPRGNREAP